MRAPISARGLTLDTGALLALDQPSKALLMQGRLDELRRRGGSICIPVGAIAQAWRSPRQVRLARLLRASDVDLAIMTVAVARTVGRLCAQGSHSDVIDVHVVVCARGRHHAVVTSDPDDIARIDPSLPLIRV
ncbi:MAG: PIN domain-containing protein [Acidimicrobiales bacterium]